VSSTKVKKALGLDHSETMKKAFTRAVQELTRNHDAGWTLEGRSLVRTGEYDFGTAD
jgi:hypothetical protein